MIATLRDIISDDPNLMWEDNSGQRYTAQEILNTWSDDLNREASCVDGAINYLDTDGYVTGAEPVLRECGSTKGAAADWEYEQRQEEEFWG